MCEKLNIIFFGGFLYPHGMAATRRKQQFIEFIKAQGHEIRVIRFLSTTERYFNLNPQKGVWKGVPFESIGDKIEWNILTLFNIIFLYFKVLNKLLHYKRKKAKNIVVILPFGSNLPIIKFLKVIGYKIIFDCVENMNSSIEKSRYLKISNLLNKLFCSKKFLQKNIDGISVITDRLVAKFDQAKGVKLVKVPISADLFITKRKQRFGHPITFLYAGTFGEKEGLEYLINAFVLAHNRYKNKIRLLLLGSCKTERINELKSLIPEDIPIFFCGRVNDEEYSEKLINADILCMTRNNTEFANYGFPYKLGEYLATGNPVIATDVSEVGLFLKNKKNAILVPPEDENELFNAMRFCIENTIQVLEIGWDGRKVCDKFFNPKRNSKIFYDLLKSV